MADRKSREEIDEAFEDAVNSTGSIAEMMADLQAKGMVTRDLLGGYHVIPEARTGPQEDQSGE